MVSTCIYIISHNTEPSKHSTMISTVQVLVHRLSKPLIAASFLIRNGLARWSLLFVFLTSSIDGRLTPVSSVPLAQRRRPLRCISGHSLWLHIQMYRGGHRLIYSAVGRSRVPTSADAQNLPYIQAIVKEVILSSSTPSPAHFNVGARESATKYTVSDRNIRDVRVNTNLSV